MIAEAFAVSIALVLYIGLAAAMATHFEQLFGSCVPLTFSGLRVLTDVVRAARPVSPSPSLSLSSSTRPSAFPFSARLNLSQS